jgi:tetratricopeptide (TPR) repeat protein
MMCVRPLPCKKTFVRLNKSGDKNWLTGMFASHPPSLERVENNTKDAASLKQDGELGVVRFAQAMAHLKKVQPAYKAYEEGAKALEAKNFSQAEKLARKAIAIEPDEGLFHALLGDAMSHKGKTRSASASYGRAIQANPGFFSFFEKRGELRNKLGDFSGYRADMKQGAALFPTVNSYLALGHFAEQDGNKDTAIRYFRAAAQSGSKNGRLAAKSLVRLDLPNNPSHYLKAHFVLDRSGNLLVSVQNPTPMPVYRVNVSIFFRGVNGQQKRLPLRSAKVIDAGKSKLIPSGIGSMNGQLLRQRGFQVRVDRAEISG